MLGCNCTQGIHQDFVEVVTGLSWECCVPTIQFALNVPTAHSGLKMLVSMKKGLSSGREYVEVRGGEIPS